MSTTKPDTDTGWSKATPEYDGYYWWRLDKDGDADPCQVREGRVYDFGDRDSVPLDGLGGDWLGPISPSDFEQLIRLRKAASDAQAWIAVQAETWTCQHADQPMRCSRCSLRQKATKLVAALREALTHTGEQS